MAVKRIHELTQILPTGINSNYYIPVDASGTSSARKLLVLSLEELVLPTQGMETNGKYLASIDGSGQWINIEVSGDQIYLDEDTGTDYPGILFSDGTYLNFLNFGASGTVLTSDGTSVYWGIISVSGNNITLNTDTNISSEDNNYIRTSGGKLEFIGAETVINQLLPDQTGNSGKVLSTNGTNILWVEAGGSGEAGVGWEINDLNDLVTDVPNTETYSQYSPFIQLNTVDRMGEIEEDKELAGQIIVQGGFEQYNVNDIDDRLGDVVIRAGSRNHNVTGSGNADTRILAIGGARVNVHGQKFGNDDPEQIYIDNEISVVDNCVSVIAGDATTENGGRVYIIGGVSTDSGQGDVVIRGGRPNNTGEVQYIGGNVYISPGADNSGQDQYPYVLIGAESLSDDGNGWTQYSPTGIYSNVPEDTNYVINLNGEDTSFEVNITNPVVDSHQPYIHLYTSGGSGIYDVLSDVVSISGNNTTIIGDTLNLETQTFNINGGSLDEEQIQEIIGSGSTFGSGDVIISAGARYGAGQRGGSLILSSAGGTLGGGPLVMTSNDWMTIGTSLPQGDGTGRNYIRFQTGGGKNATNYTGDFEIKTGDSSYSSDTFGDFTVKTSSGTLSNFEILGTNKNQNYTEAETTIRSGLFKVITGSGSALHIENTGASGIITASGDRINLYGDLYSNSKLLKANVYNDSFSGVINGINSVFTTSEEFSDSSTRVYLNGLRQKLTVDYNETSTDEITFSLAPASGSNIVIDFEVF